MKIVKITRVKNGTSLRTNTVEGVALEDPAVGRRFSIINDQPVNPSPEVNARLVSTSPVKSIERSPDNPRVFFINTENSRYLVEEIS
jgi:hypothetical protein